jgi:hypothetical protein
VEVLASVALKALALKEDMADMATLLAWAETAAGGNLVVECTMVAPGPEVVESGVGTDLDLALAGRTEECKQSFTKQI